MSRAVAVQCFYFAAQRLCVVSGVLQNSSDTMKLCCLMKAVVHSVVVPFEVVVEQTLQACFCKRFLLPLNPILTLAAISSALKLCSVPSK